MVRYVNVKVTNSKKEIVEKWRDRNITKTITIRLKVSEKNNANLWILFAVFVAGIIIYLKIK
jgi:hypothetical protein